LSDQIAEIDFSDFFYRQVNVIHAETIKRKADGYAKSSNDDSIKIVQIAKSYRLPCALLTNCVLELR